MHDHFKADGDTWLVTSDASDSQREVHTVVFHCVSNSQRPWRVVEIPDGLMRGREVREMSGGELTELFGRSQTMDYSHDAAADPLSHGFGEPPQI